MATSRDDLLDLSDYAWQRLRGRMAGLTDAEYRWRPAESSAVTAMPWRLGHIADFLTEQRNAVWLGLSATEIGRGGELDTAAAEIDRESEPDTAATEIEREGEPDTAATEVERDGEPDTAAAALAALDAAYASWRALLDACTEDGLAAPIGTPAGRYGAATRRSFVLHVLDELIHHGAEAALLRDLYSATR